MFTDITTIADVDQCTCSQELLSVIMITDGECSCGDPYPIEMNVYLSRELSH